MNTDSILNILLILKIFASFPILVTPSIFTIRMLCVAYIFLSYGDGWSSGSSITYSYNGVPFLDHISFTSSKYFTKSFVGICLLVLLMV